MPSIYNIPGRREQCCSPCEHLERKVGIRGGPGNGWDWWLCTHPEAVALSEEPEIRDKQIELRARMEELGAHGRSIGKSVVAKQPEWCPLKRDPVD